MNMVEKSLKFTKPKTTYDDTLRFTAYAWSKLLYMQSAGNTEVAGYCITETEDPLLVTDFKLIQQQCSSVKFDLDKDDMAEYQELMLDAELTIWQTCRILAHTHPGTSPNPSQDDEENFKKVFTQPDWAIMLIIAENGAIYCRLKINTAPGVEKLLKVSIDFSQNFRASDHQKWKEEYKAKVTEIKFRMTGKEKAVDDTRADLLSNMADEYEIWAENNEDLEDMDYHWNSSGEVMCWRGKDEGILYAYDPDEQKWYKDDEEIDAPEGMWAKKMVVWACENVENIL